MDQLLKNRDYKKVFYHFSEISKIPRGSGNEAQLSNYLIEFAKEYGLECYQDSCKNVILIKEASVGYENLPAIMLQGHMDMVCEKKHENTHDFLTEGIDLLVDGDYLTAKDTTLGADNGIAVAYIMSLFTDQELKHPRLEAIITTDEEVGMNGAKGLDVSPLNGKFLINLDSDEEGYLLCSCAGGLTGTSTIPVKRVPIIGKKYKLEIKGLLGGHSGMEIVNNRSNANKLLGRILFELNHKYNLYVDTMFGGYKDNVITRESYAELIIENPTKESINEFTELVEQEINSIKQELKASEPELNYILEEITEGEFSPLHPVSLEKVLFFLVQAPYGVQMMSSEMTGLVESSLNLGLLRLEEDTASICHSIRSSKKSYKHFLSDKLEYLTDFLGGEYIIRNEYPAWEFNADSKLRNHIQNLYQREYGKDMIVKAIHAGLECGIIMEKIPGIDAVSIGPDMSGIHTIEERVDIASAIRVYRFLEQVLEEKMQ